jgi:UPF0716 protein FxsA
MQFIWFLLAIFLYIYAEFSLLVSVGSSIGVLPLLLLMFAISALGLWLIKARGAYTLWQIRKEISQGQIPTQAVASSVFFVAAGVLFLIPGFLSDILAILLLLPITRNLCQALLFKFLGKRISFFSFSQNTFSTQHSSQQNTTFEAEFERKADDDKRIK